MEKKTKSTTVVDENHTSADSGRKLHIQKANLKLYRLTQFLSLSQQNFRKSHLHFLIHLHLKMTQPLFQAAKGNCNNRRYKLLPQSDGAYR